MTAEVLCLIDDFEMLETLAMLEMLEIPEMLKEARAEGAKENI